MVEPTVVSTQASSSPSYGPNIAPARMFCKMTNVRRCYCLCNIEVWYADLINVSIEMESKSCLKWGHWLTGAVVCGGANSITEK